MRGAGTRRAGTNTRPAGADADTEADVHPYTIADEHRAADRHAYSHQHTDGHEHTAAD